MKAADCRSLDMCATGTASGKLKGNYEVNLINLPQTGVADVQKKVLVQGVAGALGALAIDYAQVEKAAP
ncbi:MAG: hypothetical protein ABJA60_12430 [Nitrosospira sp.]